MLSDNAEKYVLTKNTERNMQGKSYFLLVLTELQNGRVCKGHLEVILVTFNPKKTYRRS